MNPELHITSGDTAGNSLTNSGIPGEVFVWHDILYNGPRKPGWPDEAVLKARAEFLERSTGGGLSKPYVLKTLVAQYARLKTAVEENTLMLWFDACLFDQAMLCHILTCIRFLKKEEVDLFCIDAFPGVQPFHGIGQLSPEQLASIYNQYQPIKLKTEHFRFAERVDRTFALQDQAEFKKLSNLTDAPLPWVPAAVTRWMMENPESSTGLGRLESLVLEAIRSGCETTAEIYSFVSERETPPQFWGDITLWEKINTLAVRTPPLLRIEGPQARLPQWDGIAELKLFRIYPIKPNQ